MRQLFKAMVEDPAIAISVAVAIGAGSIVAVHAFRHFPVKFEQNLTNHTANCECGTVPKGRKEVPVNVKP